MEPAYRSLRRLASAILTSVSGDLNRSVDVGGVAFPVLCATRNVAAERGFEECVHRVAIRAFCRLSSRRGGQLNFHLARFRVAQQSAWVVRRRAVCLPNPSPKFFLL